MWRWQLCDVIDCIGTSRSPWWSLMESPAGCDLPTKLQDGTERWWKHVESFVKDNLSLHQRSLQIVSCHLNLIFSKETGMATKKPLAPGHPWPLPTWKRGKAPLLPRDDAKHRSISTCDGRAAQSMRRWSGPRWPRFPHVDGKTAPGPAGPGFATIGFSPVETVATVSKISGLCWYMLISDIYIYRYLDIFWILLVHSASAIPHNPPNTINTCVGEAELLWSRRLVSTSLSRCYGWIFVKPCVAYAWHFFFHDGVGDSWGVGPARRCETLVPHGAARIQVWCHERSRYPCRSRDGLSFGAICRAFAGNARTCAPWFPLWFRCTCCASEQTSQRPSLASGSNGCSMLSGCVYWSGWITQYVPPSARCVTWNMGCVICWLQWRNMKESDHDLSDFRPTLWEMQAEAPWLLVALAADVRERNKAGDNVMNILFYKHKEKRGEK